MVNGYAAASLQDALERRAALEYTPYSGGTDLMIDGENKAKYLFLHNVPEMRGISRDAEYIRVGAECTFTEIAEHGLTPAILREAVLEIAAPAIRNLGTIGGNIANGSPKADTAPVLYVTGAKLRLASVRGERVIPISEFYLGRKKTALAPDELIVEFLIPVSGHGNYYYRKVGAREALAISRVSFAAVLDTDSGVITKLSAAFGAVADTVVCRPDIDAMLIGKTLGEARELKDAYIAAVSEAIVPIRGRVSAEYRKDVCLNLLKDFLTEKLV